MILKKVIKSEPDMESQQRNRNCIFKNGRSGTESTMPEIANPLNMGLRANGAGEESVDANI